MLAEELEQIGMQEVSIDQNAYVMATLPATMERKVPAIGFISHFDTSPDFTPAGVHPKLVRNYDGSEIVLNREKDIRLSPDYFEELKQYKGQTLIVTDGTTLLGADDKAGITEIVSAMEYLIRHPEINHGKVRVAFTPDEEIGRGAHHFDVQAFGAEWAYTVDGGAVGELEYENFNAASTVIHVDGKSVHPGSAKNKMVNAIGILNELLSGLPKTEIPQRTEGRQGFFHIYSISGSIEHAWAEMIIRDHDRDAFEERKGLLEGLIVKSNQQHGDYARVEIKDQYFNMKEKVEPVMHIVDIARDAMEAVGIEPDIKPIRGGTDGSQLSFMGLPCPNIFAGGHNFHGKYEYLPAESMQKAVEVIVKICELTAKRNW
jgi:tripeptide aminopeptidase